MWFRTWERPVIAEVKQPFKTIKTDNANLPSVVEEPEPLPDGWDEVVTSDGSTYYVNKNTDETVSFVSFLLLNIYLYMVINRLGKGQKLKRCLSPLLEKFKIYSP